jgi:hypothetical protein
MLAIEVFALPAPDELIAPGAVAEVDVPSEPVALERLEVAVDRGEVESQALRELLGRHGAVRREERLEDQPPRRRKPQAAPP